jgi:DNA end-binding protein Ku
MPARATWSGFLKLSLVSVPVKAYTAAISGGNEVHLNQLHAECNSRIQYKKTCPLHGEVSGDAIVSGYEFAKDQYVVIDTDEIDKLRKPSDKAVTIDAFVRPDAIDPIYLAGRSYFIVPDGPVGQKPYGLLYQAMVEKERYAVATVVFSGREQLVVLRPLDGLIAMSMLSYDDQLKKPAAFKDELAKQEISPEELSLAKTLVDASTPKEFDFAKYKDVYREKLTTLIQAKVDGKEIVAPPVQEEAQVINLMDALRQSVARAQQVSPTELIEKAAKKMAPSVKPESGRRKKKMA